MNEIIDGYISDIHKNGDFILEQLLQKIDSIFINDYHLRIQRYYESVRERGRSPN